MAMTRIKSTCAEAKNKAEQTYAKIKAELSSPKDIFGDLGLGYLGYRIGSAFIEGLVGLFVEPKRLFEDRSVEMCRNIMGVKGGAIVNYNACNPPLDDYVFFRDGFDFVEKVAPPTLAVVAALNKFGVFDTCRNLETKAVAPGKEYTSPAPK